MKVRVDTGYEVVCLAEPDIERDGVYEYFDGRIVPILITIGHKSSAFLYRSGGSREVTMLCIEGYAERLFVLTGEAVSTRFKNTMDYLHAQSRLDGLPDRFYHTLAVDIVRKRFDIERIQYYESWPERE